MNSMNMSTVKAIALDGKQVVQIKDSNNKVLWQKQGVTIDINGHVDISQELDYDTFDDLLD